MLLYHAFPRGVEKSRANEVGVEQLKMIKEYGLLLTPEPFSIPRNPRAAWYEDDQPQVEFIQTRACFTLVEREELWSGWRGTDSEAHFKLFGDFAIGLKPSDARKLGAVPVFYVYDAFGSETDSAGDINLTREMIFNLRELRSVCIALARLEAKANIPDRDTLSLETLDRIGYVLRGDPIVKRRIEQVDPERAREAVDLLDTVRGPAWSLVDLIDITLNFFQKTDSPKGGQHEYYQQREWRIVQLFNPGLRCQRLDPYLKELDANVELPNGEHYDLCRRLLEINPEFFMKMNRLRDSAILRGTSAYRGAGARDFFDFVEEIICPRDAADDVKQLDERDEFRQLEVEGHVVFVRGDGANECAT